MEVATFRLLLQCSLASRRSWLEFGFQEAGEMYSKYIWLDKLVVNYEVMVQQYLSTLKPTLAPQVKALFVNIVFANYKTIISSL